MSFTKIGVTNNYSVQLGERIRVLSVLSKFSRIYVHRTNQRFESIQGDLIAGQRWRRLLLSERPGRAHPLSQLPTHTCYF